MLLQQRFTRITNLCVQASIFLALMWSGSVTRAQAQDPDYSKVDDILDGRRTLLAIDDLVITGSSYSPSAGRRAYTEILTTKSSQPQKSTSETTPFETRQNIKIFKGMFFNRPQATTIEVLPNGAGAKDGTAVYIPFLRTRSVLPPTLDVDSGAVADFNNDGYDDLILNWADGSTIIATAADVNKVDKDPPFIAGPVSTLDSIWEMAAGDFNGDGQKEIAGLVVRNGDLILEIYTVDPKTLAIARASEIALAKKTNSLLNRASIAAGRFSPVAHDQLVVAFATVNGPATLETIDFAASSLEPELKSTLVTQSTPRFDGSVKVKTGRFTGQYDQIVFLFAWRGASTSGTKYLDLITVDPNTLAMTRHDQQRYDFSGQDCFYDLSVGNFDRLQPDPNSPGSTEHNPTPQVALLYGSCSAGGKAVDIVNVDPATFNWTAASHGPLSVDFNNVTLLTMTQSDTQGRSYILGEPTKVVVQNSAQPSVVIATPPMHVDFIPSAGGGTPKLLNLSVDPDGFNTTYQVEEQSNNQSSTTNTNSWSFGAKQTFGVSYSVGDLDAGSGIKLETTVKFAQDLKGSIETDHGQYSSHSFNMSQDTGVADQVWLTNSRFNIYVYPVIGKTVCPATVPNCQDKDKVPLTIQFSAPDKTSLETLAGDVVEWYQPPWEYGNVLSYPGSYSQLQQIVPDIDKLSNDLTWFTDSSNLTVQTTWATGTSGSQTTSYDQNYSFETDFSVQAAVGVLPLPRVGVSAELNFGGSVGFSNLNKSMSELGKSTGVGVKKPGTFLDPPNYGYFVTPYILGKTKPTGPVDPSQPAPADFETFSSLRTAFVVDPTRSNAGGWWRQTYTSAPDVALNHPSRWVISNPGLTDPVPDNCRPISAASTQMDCVRLAESRPGNPWLSTFHFMRGFFITSSQSPGKGPQLGSAKAGDQLALQTRVYNYSLKQMSADTVVHVRFYGQPWNAANQMPKGNSILIGEDTLSPIPPFSSDDGAPLNWVLAKTNFDTTAYGNQDLTFWVVVWMQDGNGRLVPEIASHGLTSIPGVLTSLADVQAEPFSNNVGFYKSVFHVFPAVSAEATETEEPAEIKIGKIEASERSILPGQTIEISAPLSTPQGSASGVTALFYDGDPHAGGKAFGAERAYVGADDPYDAKVSYRTNTCGKHDLFVVVGKDTPDEVSRRAAPIKVSCTGVIGLAER